MGNGKVSLAQPRLERLREDERREVAGLLAALIRAAIAEGRAGALTGGCTLPAELADASPAALQSNGKASRREGAGERA